MLMVKVGLGRARIPLYTPIEIDEPYLVSNNYYCHEVKGDFVCRWPDKHCLSLLYGYRFIAPLTKPWTEIGCLTERLIRETGSTIAHNVVTWDASGKRKRDRELDFNNRLE